MSNIKINGVSYVGDSLVVKNNKIFIDGKEHEIDSKTINISVTGNIDSISADSCQKISVKGDVNTLKTMSGDVEIEGIINGSVSTMSGDVDCGNVLGSVSTLSGDIKYRKNQ